MKILLLAVFALTGCAAAKLPSNVPPGEKDPVSVEAKFAGSETGAHEMAEFRFPKESSRIEKEARERIEKALSEARRNGAIEEIKLIAWSDNDSAPPKGRSLPKRDTSLAEKRLDALADLVGIQFRGAKISKHNMAEAPSTLARWFSGDDYRIKESLRKAGVETKGAEGTISMAGKGLMMIVLKSEAEKK